MSCSPPPYFHEKRIPDFPEFFNQLKFLLFSLLSFIYSRNKLPLHILITEVNFEMRQLDTVPETDIYKVNYFWQKRSNFSRGKRSKGVNHLFLLDSIVTFNRNVTRWLDGKIMTFTNRPKTNTSMQCSAAVVSSWWRREGRWRPPAKAKTSQCNQSLS